MLSLRLSWSELLRMYYKYIGVLGSSAPVYRFEAVWHGRAVRTVVREPVQSVRLECTVHNPLLTDGPTWDCAAVSLRAIDQNGNLLPYCGEAVQLSVEGPVKILGPAIVPCGAAWRAPILPPPVKQAVPCCTAGWRARWMWRPP